MPGTTSEKLEIFNRAAFYFRLAAIMCLITQGHILALCVHSIR